MYLYVCRQINYWLPWSHRGRWKDRFEFWLICKMQPIIFCLCVKYCTKLWSVMDRTLQALLRRCCVAAASPLFRAGWSHLCAVTSTTYSKYKVLKLCLNKSVVTVLPADSLFECLVFDRWRKSRKTHFGWLETRTQSALCSCLWSFLSGDLTSFLSAFISWPAAGFIQTTYTHSNVSITSEQISVKY